MSEKLNYDIIIAGAGPAGLFCALNCAEQGRRIAVIEKNKSAGRKLLMAGSGKCNITNAKLLDDFLLSYGKNERFVKPALYNFSNKDLIKFFQDHNMPLIELHKGKIFPKSMSSNDILNLLLNECKKKSIDFYYKEPLLECSYNDDAFILKSRTFSFKSKNFIIATGGASYPITGSTGDGYNFAKSLGHQIVDPSPALTPVIIKNYKFTDCAGNSLNDVNISLYRSNKKIGQTRGDILFTHRGLSGPGILDFSRYIKSGDHLKINMTNIKDRESLDMILIDECSRQGKKSLKKILSKFTISESIILNLLKNANIDPDLKGAMLSKNLRKLIVENLIEYTFIINYPAGYDEAMVTSGGIKLSEINPRTMESRKTKGLFFVGEVIDIDGDSGGYNLQFAFSSAKLASKHIKTI